MNIFRLPRAFTIVELLVVIAIIAVLAAILFPMFARAKDSGFRTVAMAQARQLGTALTMYQDSADNHMLPSTNYGAPESAAERLWTTVMEPQVKNKQVFIAPNSEGKFPGSWEDRGWGTVGYNGSTALDQSQGCSDDDQADASKCLAFKTVVSVSKLDHLASVAVFAMTPGGEVSDKYLGYEFGPYNGTPYPQKLHYSPPLTSDRDLVKELPLPAELLKPVYARYLKTGSDDGTTPIIFADGHSKVYSAKEINDPGGAAIVWRLH